MAGWIVSNKGWRGLFQRKTWFKLIFGTENVDQAILGGPEVEEENHHV